jgi:hypothetical protein
MTKRTKKKLPRMRPPPAGDIDLDTEPDDDNYDALELDYLELRLDIQEEWARRMFRQAVTLAKKRKVDYVV